jgi:hypothetical protein
MTLEVLEEDRRYRGVHKVRVPGIYGRKGNPLPARMSRLVLPAAQALQRVYERVVAEDGHLYVSDMFRSAVEQQRAHEDWKTGRKSAYSPPSCGSVHDGEPPATIASSTSGARWPPLSHVQQRPWILRCNQE